MIGLERPCKTTAQLSAKATRSEPLVTAAGIGTAAGVRRHISIAVTKLEFTFHK